MLTLEDLTKQSVKAAAQGDLGPFYHLINQLGHQPSWVRRDLIVAVLTKLNSARTQTNPTPVVPLEHIQTLVQQSLASGDLTIDQLVGVALRCLDVVTSQALLLVAANSKPLSSSALEPTAQSYLYQAIVAQDYSAVVAAIQAGANLRADRDQAYYLAAQTTAEDSIRILLVLLQHGFGLEPLGLAEVLTLTKSNQSDRSPARALGVFFKCLVVSKEYLPDKWSRAKAIRTLVLKYGVPVDTADHLALRLVLRHRPDGKIDTATLLMLLQLGAYPRDPAGAQLIWTELAVTTQKTWERQGSCNNNKLAVMLLEQAMLALSL